MNETLTPWYGDEYKSNKTEADVGNVYVSMETLENGMIEMIIKAPTGTITLYDEEIQDLVDATKQLYKNENGK